MGIMNVRVYNDDRTLVIESRSDPDEEIDAAANTMNMELRTHGPNSKAWVLGFATIKITNGPYIRTLRSRDYK